MGKSSLEKLPQSKVKITVKTEKEDLLTSRQKALEKLAQEIEVAGFRKGKAPLEKVRERVNDIKWGMETLDILINLLYLQGLQENKITPINQPEVNLPKEKDVYSKIVQSKAEDFDFEVEFTVEVRPVVDPKIYQDLKITKPEVKVTQKDIDEALDNIFKEWKGPQEKDESSAKSDIVTAQNINEAKEKAVEEKSLTPEEKAKKLKKEPDDEWAQFVGEKDLDSLKEKIEKLLQDVKEQEAEKKLEDSIFEELLQRSDKLEIPESLIVNQLEQEESRLKQQMESAQMTLEDFLKRQEKDMEEIRKDWRQGIERNLKIEFILQEVAFGEKIETNDEELKQEIEKIRSPEIQKQFSDEKQREYLRYMMSQRKAVSWLKEKAKKDESASKKPGKKETKKKKESVKSKKKPDSDQKKSE